MLIRNMQVFVVLAAVLIAGFEVRDTSAGRRTGDIRPSIGPDSERFDVAAR
jgi:hypothetical protein